MVQDWPDDWDATLGSTSFYAHLNKGVTRKLADVPGFLVDFYSSSGGLLSALHVASSSKAGGASSSSATAESWDAAVIRAGFICRVFDETLIARKKPVQKRAQMLVSIFKQFSPAQRAAFGKILHERGRMARTLNGLMDEALERGATSQNRKGSVRFSPASFPPSRYQKELISLVGSDVAQSIWEALVTSHRDRNIFKSVKSLCDPTYLVRRIVDKRKRIMSQLKVVQRDSDGSVLERCGQSLNAVLQTISLGGLISCSQDSIIEIVVIARQCAEEGAMGKALATTELISHLTAMSPSYAYYAFDHLVEYFMELIDLDEYEGSSQESASDEEEDSNPHNRSSLGRSHRKILAQQRRSEPTLCERDQLLVVILKIFSRTLTGHVWGNSVVNQGAPAKQAKALWNRDVRKRLMGLCLEGSSVALAEGAARAYGGMLIGSNASLRDWQKAIQEVRDGINMGGSLNTAHKKSKKKKAAAPAFESGTFPIAAAAALPVFLEMAPSSGQQITEADRSFLDTCEEIQEKALMQLRAETLMLNKLAQNADFDDDVSSDEDDRDRRDFSSRRERPAGEHAYVCVMLLLRVLRIRFKRGFDIQRTSDSPETKDEAQQVLEKVYEILENESMPVRAREGCMEAIFAFASGVSQPTRDVLTPRTYYAIGHYMLSSNFVSSDRLSILSRVHELCTHPSDDRKANFGALGNR